MTLPTFLRPRRAVRASLALLTLLGLAGCSNVPFPTDVESSNSKIGGVSEPRSYDPSFTYNEGDSPIAAVIYPSFYHYEYLRQNPYRLGLDIGASMPTLERLTPAKKGDPVERWTYRLRHDLRFQDDPCFAATGGKGRAVTAADMVFAFKRMVDPKTSCPVASYFADKVVGWGDFAKGFDTLKGKNYDQPLRGAYVDPNDPYAFKLELSRPYPQLRYLMAMTFTSPQAREALDFYGKDDYALHHPVGYGAFKLKEYVAHDHVWLVRNSNAYPQFYPSEADPDLAYLLKGNAGQPVPFVDQIYMKVVTEAVTSYSLFQQGYTDGMTVGWSNANVVPAANGLTDDMKAKGVTLVKNQRVSIDYMAFNMNDPVVGGYDEKHKKLRQAISLSIDPNAYIDICMQGMGLPAEWIIPPGIPGYDPTYKNPYRQYDPSLKKAKQLLAEAGYPNGLDARTGQRLVLNYDNYGTSPSIAQIARLNQKQIQTLGIQVNLVVDQYDLFTDKLDKKQAQFFNWGWNADYPDPENFCFNLYGPNAAPGPNDSLYNNPAYNALFEKMQAMPDGPERNKVIAQMRDVSVEDCPWIYVDYPLERSLLPAWVHGQRANALAQDGLKYARVDGAARRRFQADWNHPVYWPLGAGALVLVALVVPAGATIRSRSNRRVRKDGDSPR